jgi:hypothetical protein
LEKLIITSNKLFYGRQGMRKKLDFKGLKAKAKARAKAA